MKTHELADALEIIVGLLRKTPNTQLTEIEVRAQSESHVERSRHIAVNVATLARLAHIDKQQWLDFIDKYEIPIDLRPRDASRDIIGKVLRYLDSHPEAHRRIEAAPAGSAENESPELMKALSILLKDPSR